MPMSRMPLRSVCARHCRQHESNLLFQAALVVVGDLLSTQASRIRKKLKERP